MRQRQADLLRAGNRHAAWVEQLEAGQRDFLCRHQDRRQLCADRGEVRIRNGRQGAGARDKDRIDGKIEIGFDRRIPAIDKIDFAPAAARHDAFITLVIALIADLRAELLRG